MVVIMYHHNQTEKEATVTVFNTHKKMPADLDKIDFISPIGSRVAACVAYTVHVQDSKKWHTLTPSHHSNLQLLKYTYN